MRLIHRNRERESRTSARGMILPCEMAKSKTSLVHKKIEGKHATRNKVQKRKKDPAKEKKARDGQPTGANGRSNAGVLKKKTRRMTPKMSHGNASAATTREGGSLNLMPGVTQIILRTTRREEDHTKVFSHRTSRIRSRGEAKASKKVSTRRDKIEGKKNSRARVRQSTPLIHG